MKITKHPFVSFSALCLLSGGTIGMPEAVDIYNDSGVLLESFTGPGVRLHEAIGPTDTRYDGVVAVGVEAAMVSGPTRRDWRFLEPDGLHIKSSGGNWGTGVLLGPDVVLTNEHIFGGMSSEDVIDRLCLGSDYPLCDGPRPNFKPWVRFRRNPSGTPGVLGPIGTMGFTPLDAAVGRGPDSFYHVRVVDAIDLEGDQVLLFLEHDVSDTIEVPKIFPFTPRQRAHGSVGLMPEYTVPDALVHVAWGAMGLPATAFDEALSGEPRIATSDMIVSTGVRMPCLDAGNHDSGWPVFMTAENGDVLAIGNNGTISCPLDGVPLFSGFMDSSYAEILRPYFYSAPQDFTGTSDPFGDGYGEPDFRVDMNDVLYFAQQVVLGNSEFDRSGSSVLGNPAFGVPDGNVNLTDINWFVVHLLNTQSSTTPWPLTPIPAADSDVDRDGRFTTADFGSQVFEEIDGLPGFSLDEITILGLISGQLSTDRLGDYDGDGDVDNADFQAMSADVAAGALAWSGQQKGDADYLVALDENLDGRMTVSDHYAVAAAILPGDIGDSEIFSVISGYNTSFGERPDFVIDQYEIARGVAATFTGGPQFPQLDWSGSGDPLSPEFGVPDGELSIADTKYLLWTSYENLGTGGPREGLGPTIDTVINPFFDVNGDGRLNHNDVHDLYIASPADQALWDLDGSGDFSGLGSTMFVWGAGDLGMIGQMIHVIGYNHGVLGDYTGDSDPDLCCANGSCTSFIPLAIAGCLDVPAAAADGCDYTALVSAGGALLFDGRSYFSDTANGYMFQLDADLDGDNDVDDSYAIILDVFRIGDLNLDGAIDQTDVDVFTDLLNANHPAADLNGDQLWNTDDLLELIAMMSIPLPTCP